MFKSQIRGIETTKDIMNSANKDVMTLSPTGDILLTCFGSLSRNRRVGVRLGKGDPFEADFAGNTLGWP